eukprot:TRINITY_DN18882_c0_g1_i1.p1 TRINITY_DN18882_c0_g1~~TRINITY_DN18882_c0_g1_i1.p1  ORF type:complete len:562 (-),score=238.95 TRINITY_DN18882_c0_g1_i1:256-1941(-)
MFSPEMMAAAQNMMKNMSSEDMQRMSNMAAGMDPKTMDSMMKSMGGGGMPAGVDMKQAAEQMKNMTPDQMRSQMNQAQGQMGAQKNYVMSGATHIKNEGNNHIKKGEYTQALELYDRGLENLKPHAGDDVTQLRLAFLLNSALCHLNLKANDKAIETCNEALAIQPQSVKALYRRGLAKAQRKQGADMADAVADVKQASELSPQDEKLQSEVKRLEGEAASSGVEAKDIEAAAKKVKEDTSKPAAVSSSSSSPGVPKSFAPGGGSAASNDAQMKEAMAKMSENPEMFEKAQEAMKNMNPDDLAKMMENAPLPPGVDKETAKKQMEAMQKNPDMMKSAMDMMKNMSPEERDRMMKMRGGMGAGAGGGATPDMSAMSKAFEDPEMIKQISKMAEGMGEGDSAEAKQMKEAAKMLQQNPELGKQMSEMMKNMPPDQLENMMKMSQGMRNRQGQAGGPPGAGPDGMPDPGAMEDMMNNPEMMKAAEDMMKNMSPETLAAMAKSQGIDLDENKAAMIGKFMPYVPYLMKAYRGFIKTKKAVMGNFRVILAIVILLIAVWQHYRSSD